MTEFQTPLFDGLPEVVSVPRAADFLGVCDRTIRREIAAGRLSCIRVGRTVRITREQLAQYVSEPTMLPIYMRLIDSAND